MTVIRRVTHRLGVLVLVAPLSGAGLLMAASPAYAATGIVSPDNGVVYPTDTTVHITASLDRNSGSADLRLQSPAPGSSAQTVNSASSTLTSGGSLHYDFDTATCASFPGPCSGRAEALNGVWTVSLVSGSKMLDTRTFVLKIPPRAPASLSARADGYRAVDLSWPKGVEPDLTGWTLYADGGPSEDIGVDACSGASCATTVTYAQDGTGDHTYSLVAHRRTAPDSTDTVDSPQSPQATATLDSPPPAPANSSGSTTGGSTGGSTGGGGSTSPSGSTSGGGSTSPSGSSGGSTGAGGSTGGGGSTSPSGSSGGSTGAGGSTSGGGSTSPSGSTSGGSTSTGSGAGSTGGTSPGGSTGSQPSAAISTTAAPVTVAQRRAFALSFQAFAPKLGIPKLPPLPATAQPAVAPLPDGTYEKTLGYKDVVKQEKVDSPQAAARRVTDAVGSALDSSQFLRSIAGALVLLLMAAHLRRWLGSHDAD